MRLVQISDTHLTVAGGPMSRNLARVAAFVNEHLKPDLVVHTGDIIAIDPDSPVDRDYALNSHGAFEAAVRFIPGNHDVGDAGPSPWMGLGVTPGRIQAHRDAFGPDRFVETHRRWVIVGFSSEVLGSGLPEEDEQWEWLAQVFADAPADAQIMLMCHQPIWSAWPGAQPNVSVPPAARARLLSMAGRHRLKATATGHLHVYQSRPRGETREVWCPSTSVLGATPQSRLEQLGVVEWELADGHCRSWFRAPHDLEEHVIDAIPEIAMEIERIAVGGSDGVSSPNAGRAEGASR